MKSLKNYEKSCDFSVIFNRIPYNSTRIIPKMRDELHRRGEDVEFVFIVLTSNNVHTYADVKKLCILDFAGKLFIMRR